MTFVREGLWPGDDFDLVAEVRRCQAAGLDVVRRSNVQPSCAWVIEGQTEAGDDIVVCCGPIEAVADLAGRWSGALLALAPVDFRFFSQKVA